MTKDQGALLEALARNACEVYTGRVIRFKSKSGVVVRPPRWWIVQQNLEKAGISLLRAHEAKVKAAALEEAADDDYWNEDRYGWACADWLRARAKEVREE